MKPKSSPSAPGTRTAGRSNAGKEFLVYIGSYNTAKGKGIHAFRFDAAAGRLTSMGLATEAVNPTFVTASADGRFLYATKEVTRHEGRKSGSVKAFAIDRKTGKLRFLNEVASGGTVPCYVALDKTGRYAMVANYGSGSVEVIQVRRDGRLGKVTAFDQYAGSGVNPERQEGPHAHSINVSPDNRFALAADLGLDKVFVYRFDEKAGTLAPNHPAYAVVNAGSGPRHIAFARNGRFVYVIGEMKSNITVFCLRRPPRNAAQAADHLDAAERLQAAERLRRSCRESRRGNLSTDRTADTTASQCLRPTRRREHSLPLSACRAAASVRATSPSTLRAPTFWRPTRSRTPWWSLPLTARPAG